MLNKSCIRIPILKIGIFISTLCIQTNNAITEYNDTGLKPLSDRCTAGNI